MTDPNKTNEDINEKLSTDELKSVSGGLVVGGEGVVVDLVKGKEGKDKDSDFLHQGRSGSCGPERYD